MSANWQTTFVPAGSITFSPIEQTGSFALPAVDGSNLDLVITATGGDLVWFAFNGAVVPNPPGPGALVIGAGQALLFTNSAAILAAAAANPAVIGISQAAATTISAWTRFRGGTVTVTRGTATPRLTF